MTGSNILEIIAKNIRDWFEKAENRVKFPELVRRLILETTPQPLSSNMQVNEIKPTVVEGKVSC